MASILAIFFLVFFAVLAIAHATLTGVSLAQAGNQNAALNAQMEAEGGLSFLTYMVGRVNLPANASGQAMMNGIAAYVGGQLNNSATLGGGSITYDGSTTVSIPSVVMDTSTDRRFTATITKLSDTSVRLSVTGQSGGARRSVRLDYTLAAGTNPLLNYGIATKSDVQLNGNSRIRGANNAAEANILSGTYTTNPAFKLNGNVSIQGDVSASSPDAQVSMTGNCSIGGVASSNPSINSHIHLGIGAVDFPEVDPTVFESFATNIVDSHTSTSGNKTFNNIRIRANTNPTFSGNINLNGVVYIEQPNKVTFAGNLNVTGVIVTQDAGDNVYTANTIKFAGNTTSRGVDQLPDTADFHTLRSMTGSFLLAPGFGVEFTGNFGTVNGAMAADQFKFTGNAGGTVKGMIINYSDSSFILNGNSSIVIDKSTGNTTPPGIACPSTLQANADTYKEH
jgi:hypothetical protein